jgi:hypothetical protein
VKKLETKDFPWGLVVSSCRYDRMNSYSIVLTMEFIRAQQACRARKALTACSLACEVDDIIEIRQHTVEPEKHRPQP